MRTTLIPYVVALAAAPLAAQSHTIELVNYMGGSNPGSPPWGVYRNVDLDGDGVFLSQSPQETSDFAIDGNVLVNHVNDLRYVLTAGVPTVYAAANGNNGDFVLAFVDLNGDGDCLDANEIQVFADVQALIGGNASVDGLDHDGNTGEFYLTDDNWAGGPQPGAGIHMLVDLNGDGDAMDAGEWKQFVDATAGPVSVAGTGGPVTADIGDFEAVMVDSNSVVIAWAQQDLVFYAMQDMNGDGDAMDAGEMWNFMNLVGDTPGLEQNADVMNGVLPNPSCPSTSGSGLYATMEWIDVSHGAGPGGADVYWFASTASAGSCNGGEGYVFQGIDLNGDGDLNDAGEVTAFHDNAQSALPAPPSGIYGMTAHDEGVTIWVNSAAKDCYYLFDTNGDRVSGVGEYRHMATFPSSPYADGICAVPVGAFALPLPAPPYFLPFGTSGTGTGGTTPEIGNVGTPVTGASFDVTLTDALPGVPVQLAIGFSDSDWQRPNGSILPLPFDMGPVGAPGNTLYVSVDLTVPTFTNALGDAAVTLNVPASASLVGREVFFQWGCSDGINARQLTMSNAARSIIE